MTELEALRERHALTLKLIQPLLDALMGMDFDKVPVQVKRALTSIHAHSPEMHAMVHVAGLDKSDKDHIKPGFEHKVEMVGLKDGKVQIVECNHDWVGAGRNDLTTDQWREGMANIDAVVPTTDEQIQQNRNDAQDARTDKPSSPSPLAGQHFEGTIKGIIDADGNAKQDGDVEVEITDPEGDE